MNFIKLGIYVVGATMLMGCGNKEASNTATTKVTPNQTLTQNGFVFDKVRDESNFPSYINELKKYAITQGITQETLDIAFKDVHFIDHVVKADQNQPEKKQTVEMYLSRAVSPARINLAKDKFLQYHSQIGNATLLTNVPKPYILALWGVESAYGKYQGKEDIISALSTLAYEGRREKFFTKELISALQILQKGNIAKSEFKGSWAGAMGQNQFMPSSYLAYGLDGDGDGKIDIWNNMSDIFASIGNYLATVGWNEKEGWGQKVKLSSRFDINLAGLDDNKAKTVSDWLKLGVKLNNNNVKPNMLTKAWLIIPDEDNAVDSSTNAYLVFQNFKTLMHWNRSYSFALSVGMIADNLTYAPLHVTQENNR
ncbi:lytic murein transglycosylase [Orbaceae bacterium ac157xtp]